MYENFKKIHKYIYDIKRLVQVQQLLLILGVGTL